MNKTFRKRASSYFLNTLAVAMSLQMVFAPDAQAGLFTSEKTAFQDLSQKPATWKERAVIEAFAFLVNTNQLEGFLAGTIKIAKYVPGVGGGLRDIPPETLETGLHIGAEAIRMMVQMQGEAKAYPEITYLNWLHSSRWMDRRLTQQELNRKEPADNSVSDSRYYQELLSLAESKASWARDLEILVDGPASFARREQIILSAKKSVDVMVWAILDDETGFELRDQLIQKHREGLDVRVIVDGLVNQRRGYRQAVKDLEKSGVKVVRWRHKETPFFGQHRKMLIVDGTHMVAGGLNPGNSYSHKAVADKDKWRDTDIYATGEIVQDGNKLFAQIWNEQAPMKVMAVRESAIRNGNIAVSLVELMPDIKRQTGSTVMLSVLKAIRGAQQSIDIENAYVILFPQLETEIRKALRRGVRVRVLTNSDKSVDEAVISQPMMISAKRLAEMGAEVYLRKGSTLHSKFMIVDNRLVLIGSYNLHPRSERIEGEMVFLINDAKTAHDFSRVFENDLRADIAQKSSAEQIKPEVSFVVRFTLRYFYDLL